MNFFFKRLREGSTWGGLGLITYGLGNIFQIDQAPAIAQAVGQTGEAVVSTGDWKTGILTLITGVAAAFIVDKPDPAPGQ